MHAVRSRPSWASRSTRSMHGATRPTSNHSRQAATSFVGSRPAPKMMRWGGGGGRGARRVALGRGVLLLGGPPPRGPKGRGASGGHDPAGPPPSARGPRVVLRNDVPRLRGIGSYHARLPPRREQRRSVRISVPAPDSTPAHARRRFRQNEMHDIVGIARRVACAVLAGNDIVRGRDEGAQLLRGVALSAERRHKRRRFGVHDCPEPPVSLREAQQTVDGWIGQYKEGYFPPLTNL